MKKQIGKWTILYYAEGVHVCDYNNLATCHRWYKADGAGATALDHVLSFPKESGGYLSEEQLIDWIVRWYESDIKPISPAKSDTKLLVEAHQLITRLNLELAEFCKARTYREEFEGHTNCVCWDTAQLEKAYANRVR